MTEYEINLAIHYNNGCIRAAKLIIETCTLSQDNIIEIESLINDWEGNIEYYKELLNFQATPKQSE